MKNKTFINLAVMAVILAISLCCTHSFAQSAPPIKFENGVLMEDFNGDGIYQPYKKENLPAGIDPTKYFAEQWQVLNSPTPEDGTIPIVNAPAAVETIRQVPSSQYPTIQAAINASNPGDTVLIGPGVFNENLTGIGRGITVKGSGANLTTVVGTISLGADNSVLRDIKSVGGMLVEGPATIQNNIILGPGNIYVHVIDLGGWVGGAKFYNNVIGSGGTGIANCYLLPMEAKNNIFYNLGIDTDFCTSTGSNPRPVVFDYNLFYNISFYNENGMLMSHSLDPSGVGNIIANPKFRDMTNYILDYGSPAIDSGDPSFPYNLEPTPNGSKINMGSYGNTPLATTMYPPPKTGCSAMEIKKGMCSANNAVVN